MKKYSIFLAIAHIFLGISNDIYSSAKQKKIFKAGSLALIGAGTGAKITQQLQEKSIEDRKKNFIQKVKENPMVNSKVRALNQTIYKALDKNIYYYDYLNPKHRKIAYDESSMPLIVADNKKNEELSAAMKEYTETVSTETVNYYKNIINEALTVGSLVSLPLAGYLIGRSVPIIVSNPRTIIPSMIGRAVVIGIFGALAASASADFIDQDPDLIINSCVSLYEKYEKPIHEELDKCITNEIQAVRELLEYNGSRAIKWLIKKRPSEETFFTIAHKQGSQKAFARFNKKYLHSKDRPFFIRYMAPFFIPSDLKMIEQLKEK